MNGLFRWLCDRMRGNVVSDAVEPETTLTNRSTNEFSPRLFNLAHSHELTLDLLGSASSWRERLVHEIDLRDSDYVDFSTSYQVTLPLDLVKEYEHDVRIGDNVRLMLPFAIRPKQLLLNLDFSGHEGCHVSLLLRDRIADIQARHLFRLNGADYDTESVDYSIFTGISGYLMSGWREEKTRTEDSLYRHKYRKKWHKLLPDKASNVIKRRLYKRGKMSKEEVRIEALKSYLNGDIDSADVESHHVEHWLQRLEDTRLKLVESLGEGESEDSSSECILLAMPFMKQSPKNKDQIDEIVDYYIGTVNNMEADALKALAEYGRRWLAVIETVIPVGIPSSVKLSEQRPWQGSSRDTMEQEISFGDARTTHVEIRVAGHGVEIDTPVVTDLSGEKVGFVDEMRRTADVAAIYASDSRRPDYARVSVKARVGVAYQALVLWIFYPIIAVAIWAALSLRVVAGFVDALAILVFPITLVGAFVISRAPTSLAERLLLPWRVFMGLLIVALWLITIVRLVIYAEFDNTSTT